MDGIILRGYQSRLIEAAKNAMLNGKSRPLIVAPTGSGKTVLFSAFTKRACSKGRRVLILAHRDELLDQISQTLSAFKVPHGFFSRSRGYDIQSQVQVGSCFTVARRLDQLPRPDLIIVDEAHHAAKSSTWEKILSYYNTWTLGVTATPCRLSGEPLGEVFDEMLIGPATADLISQGYLSDFKIFAPATVDTSTLKMSMGDFNKTQLSELMDKPTIVGSAVSEYKRHLNGKQAAVYCVSVEHAQNTAAEFRARGISSACIYGGMKTDERRDIVDNFRKGRLKVITNCGILTEGFDIPGLEGVIMLRPTASLSLYMQMVGRALRTFSGKTHAIILDHSGNVQRHGFPDDSREWSLYSKVSPVKKSDAAESVRICEKCFAAFKSIQRVCPYCGHEAPVKPVRPPTLTAGELKELKREQVASRKKEQGSYQTEQQLIELGIKRGYKRPRLWAKHVMRGRKQRGR